MHAKHHIMLPAWCNSNDINAPLKAEELLRKLETNPEYPKRNGTLVVRPNLLSYNTVIDSWAKSKQLDSAARAEALLTSMLRRYKTEAFSTVKPDVVTFSCVLNALAKSKIAHKGMWLNITALLILPKWSDLNFVQHHPYASWKMLRYSRVNDSSTWWRWKLWNHTKCYLLKHNLERMCIFGFRWRRWKETSLWVWQ